MGWEGRQWSSAAYGFQLPTQHGKGGHLRFSASPLRITLCDGLCPCDFLPERWHAASAQEEAVTGRRSIRILISRRGTPRRYGLRINVGA